MRISVRSVFSMTALLALVAPAAHAGGAWVYNQGDGDIQLGYSVKTADSSWTARGNEVDNASWHIFRYVYAGGEAGLGKGLSFRYLALYLDGLEGRRGDMEHNAGFSELFMGLKYRVSEGTWPMAVAFNYRTSYLYDLPGQYDRHLFTEDDDEAIFKGVSPEWRGLLGEDYGLSYLVSRSMFEGGGWMNFEVGYTYRTTNLGDEIPLYFEIGYPLGWQKLILKGTYRWVQSVGNNSDREYPATASAAPPPTASPTPASW